MLPPLSFPLGEGIFSQSPSCFWLKKERKKTFYFGSVDGNMVFHSPKLLLFWFLKVAFCFQLHSHRAALRMQSGFHAASNLLI